MPDVARAQPVAELRRSYRDGQGLVGVQPHVYNRNFRGSNFLEEVTMAIRKMLLVCVLAAAAMLPLVGCKGSADKPKGGDTTPATTSNTTAE